MRALSATALFHRTAAPKTVLLLRGGSLECRAEVDARGMTALDVEAAGNARANSLVDMVGVVGGKEVVGWWVEGGG